MSHRAVGHFPLPVGAPLAELAAIASHYPGIKNVEHEYFYAVHGADDATRQASLERAQALGREF